MRDIGISLFLFCMAVGGHMAWCRQRRASRLHIGPFVYMAFFGLLLQICVLFLVKKLPSEEYPVNFWTLPLKASSLLLYLLLIPTYLAFYFNTQVESPTQKILRLLQKNKQSSTEDLENAITDAEIIIPRVRDLAGTGFLAFDGKVYRLTPRGIILARFLNLYQTVLGREIGG